MKILKFKKILKSMNKKYNKLILKLSDKMYLID